jgi:hypothetical protein
MQKQVKLSEVVELLKSGFTRYKKDDKGSGSIEEKLSLTPAEAKELFKHPKLVGLKTRPVTLQIVDDLADRTTAPASLTSQPAVTTAVRDEVFSS